MGIETMIWWLFNAVVFFFGFFFHDVCTVVWSSFLVGALYVNSSALEQNDRPFADDIFKFISMNHETFILAFNSLKPGGAI